MPNFLQRWWASLRHPFISPPAAIQQTQFDLQTRLQGIVSGLLENEALTELLDDRAAQTLLDWGKECAERAVNAAAQMNEKQAELALDPQLKAMRQMLRQVSRCASATNLNDPAQSKAWLETLAQSAAQFYGPHYVSPDPQTILAQLASCAGQPSQVITCLRAWLEPASDSTSPLMPGDSPHA